MVYLILVLCGAAGGYIVGGSAVALTDCSGNWWNPVVFYHQLSAIQNSPWAWALGDFRLVVMEARKEFLAGGLLVGTTAAAYCWSGPAGAMQAYSLVRGQLSQQHQMRLPQVVTTPMTNGSFGTSGTSRGYTGVPSSGPAQGQITTGGGASYGGGYGGHGRPMGHGDPQLQLMFPTHSLDGS
jgi:hypothetical protein